MAAKEEGKDKANVGCGGSSKKIKSNVKAYATRIHVPSFHCYLLAEFHAI